MKFIRVLLEVGTGTPSMFSEHSTCLKAKWTSRLSKPLSNFPRLINLRHSSTLKNSENPELNSYKN